MKASTDRTVSPETKLSCYHCGLDCPDGSNDLGDKHFCCSGCRAVYLFLTENGLDNYYSKDPAPGVRPRPESVDSRFAYLDNPEVVSRLSDYSSDRRCRIRLNIPQIHCASCIWLLENLGRINPAVLSSRVDFPRRELNVLFDNSALSLRGLVELLSRIGYEPLISNENLDETTAPDHNRELYIKTGIAGFCFANIMLLSFPEYLAGSADSSTELESVFRILSLILALPVLLYAATGYFRSAWYGLLQHRLNIDVPIALGMIILFGRSSYEIISGIGAGYLDSFAGFTFFLLLGRLFQQKTYGRMSFERDYRSFFPVAVMRKAGDHLQPVTLDKLEIGDRVVIRHRELIPADGVVAEGRAIVDYSFVTGESEPVEIGAGETVLAGGRQIGSAMELILTRKVSNSYLVSLWSNGSIHEQDTKSVSSLVDRVAVWFTAAVILIALGAGLVWMKTDIGMAVNVTTAVLIVACPCALALAGPFGFGTALRLMARNMFFVRDTAVVEKMSTINSILFDKTGTLTSSVSDRIEFVGAELTEREKQMVASLAYNTVHPLGKALITVSEDSTVLPVENFVEHPGRGMAGVVDGRYLRMGNAAFIGADRSLSQDSNSENSEVWLSVDDAIRGRFIFPETFRPGIDSMVADLAVDYELMITSGDTPRERQKLRAILGDHVTMEFEQSPHDKLSKVKRLVGSGRRVLMVGDGLNDAGALVAADVGVAVTENSAAVTPACDGILDAAKLTSIPRYLKLAKSTVSVVWSAYGLSFAYNIVGLYYAVTGQLSPILSAVLMPLSSMTVVLFTVAATRYRAGRMGL